MANENMEQISSKMVTAARRTVQIWKSNPDLTGEPSFIVFSDKKMDENAPFRFYLLEITPDGLTYAIHAHDILTLAGEEKPEIAAARAELIKQWAS
jgi:hypothetical protein